MPPGGNPVINVTGTSTNKVAPVQDEQAVIGVSSVDTYNVLKQMYNYDCVATAPFDVQCLEVSAASYTNHLCHLCRFTPVFILLRYTRSVPDKNL